MKRIAILLASAISLAAGAASAEDYTIGAIRIANPWARATPRGADIAGAYMTVRNTGKAPDRLVGGSGDDLISPIRAVGFRKEGISAFLRRARIDKNGLRHRRIIQSGSRSRRR